MFMNGVGCMVHNFYGRYVSKHDMLISMKHKGIIEISKYEGGLVLEPREFDISDIDKYLNEFSEMLNMPIKDLIKYLDTLGIQLLVADLDFTSMYPSTIITQNISKDTNIDINSQDDDLNTVED